MKNEKYEEFLGSKRIDVEPVGIDKQVDINPKLFDFQEHIVRWALRRGRAAVFADCGLGKTPIQLEWGKHIPGNILICAPLAVSQQTVREGKKFDIEVKYCRHADEIDGKITITNYEMLRKFDPVHFSGLILDESSILKSFGGIYRRDLIAFAKHIPYRLACTATPAPNDLIELSNHAEFLDIMSHKEIMALFFRLDGNNAHNWILKGHARSDFWRWMASWSVALRAPSDLGYDDKKFKLPPLRLHEHTVKIDKPDPGMLFALEAKTLEERRRARSGSTGERVKLLSEIINGNGEQWLVWCNLNKESDMATHAIKGAVEVKGADSIEHKESSLLAFANGDIQCLVTKPSIAGHGLNLQKCSNMAFLGLSDSYEQFYQALRRCWRFGQKSPVDAHIIVANTEGAVRRNIERKEAQAMEMMSEITSHMRDIQGGRAVHTEADYEEDIDSGQGWTMMLGDSVKRIKEIEKETVGLTVFSPPFPGMYAYTNSRRDIGNVGSIEGLLHHFEFLVDEMYRITIPGRSCCIHLTQEPIFKRNEGYSGLRDFRGEIIRLMQAHDWIFASERTIDKDPQLKAQRTKDQGLAMKTAAKDSSVLTGTMPDYLLQFKKRGDNPIPIRALIDHPKDKLKNKDGWITREDWIQWASAVWYGKHRIGKGGISESDVLSARPAKDEDDEKHLCPLQLGVIERCIKLWSAPDDLVFSPFAGIGSEGYQAIKFGRRFAGIELKRIYWGASCRNLRDAERFQKTLFSGIEA